MSDVDELLEESQCDFFWLPEDVRVVARPELTYCASQREVPLFNRGLRLRAPDRDVGGLLREVLEAHEGRESHWQVGSPSASPALEAGLHGLGYREGCVHHACTLSVEALRPAPSAGITVAPVTSLGGLADFEQVAREAFGTLAGSTAAEREQYLAACTGAGARVHRFVAYEATGRPISVGAMTSFAELGLGLLWSGATVPTARGRGAYTAVVTARVERARELGLERVGLYARVGTSAPIVAAQGFERHGEMVQWSRPPG